METITLGIDLAKSSFSLVAMNQRGKIILRKTLSRGKLLNFIANYPKAIIAMEACSGAHYWGKEFEKLGHNVKIIAAKFISPFRKGVKNDNNDAEAICEAGQRPNIHIIPIKNNEQLALQALHRIRELAVKERTALINQAHGLLAEYGLIFPKGKKAFTSHIPALLEDAENDLPDRARLVIGDLLERYHQLHQRILAYDRELSRECRENIQAKRILSIPGVGDKTATGIIAAVPNPRMFDNSHQFAAWLGLTPKQYSTGGKIRLGKITKAGNSYLRMCLIQGARNIIRDLDKNDDEVSRWLRGVLERRGYFRALVAMAARNARLIWTLLVKEEFYQARVETKETSPC